ncbi:MAG: DNA polymerase IV [Putridiphycobacter sp.]
MSNNFRKIIHVDMDAFYASVEQLDYPELKGKPVAVGGNAERGVVAAASYEARKFGVKSAMSSVLAKRKCKDLIFVKPRFERYKEISQQIRNIFYDYTDLVEPLALDEAFLDVTVNKKEIPLAGDIAKEIRKRIYEETGLTASAGISINKFMAKMATEVNKPNGQKTIHPNEIEKFLEQLPIQKFFGVGKVTAGKMNAWGIYNGYDLKRQSLPFLTAKFGKSGEHFYNIVRCIHNSPVKPNRERKSVGAERTFFDNITSETFILEKLEDISKEVENRLKAIKKSGKTITIKIKFSDFTQRTRSKTLHYYTNNFRDLKKVIEELVYQEEIKKSVRLLGVSVSNFEQVDVAKAVLPVQLSFKFR